MTITAPTSPADLPATAISAGERERVAHDKRTSKVDRLNAASVRKVIEPDTDVPGSVGEGQVISDRMLSVAGLNLDLTAEQRATLSREEMASIFDAGVRFEATLMASFSQSLVRRDDLTDPRVTYMLHEIGEETRHSRLFIRVISQLAPTAHNPFSGPIFRLVDRVVTGWVMRREALFMVMVLFGEEGPDLLQRLAVDDDGTDPFIREVNRYHRAEEARHLAYGRTVLGELFANASWVERVAIRHVAPTIGAEMFDSLVHPGVYATIGLPTWKTWNAARRTPERAELRRLMLTPVHDALVKAGVFRRGRTTRAWRKAIAS